MTVYLDASALVKAYVGEPESDRVRRGLRTWKATTSVYTRIEVASGVRRRARAGELSQNAAAQAMRSLHRHTARMRLVEVTPGVVARALKLLGRHALRAGDALQLASALEIAAVTGVSVRFLCYDERLAMAARAEHLAEPSDGASATPR